MPRLTGTATQGGADAFAEATINTALSGQTRQGYNVTRLSLELSTGFNWPATSEVEVSLTRRTKAAMPDIDDPDVLKKWKVRNAVLTSGTTVADALLEFLPPDRSMIIVEDPIFLQIDSTSTTGTQSAIVVIEFEVITLSEVDRLSILVASLG